MNMSVESPTISVRDFLPFYSKFIKVSEKNPEIVWRFRDFVTLLLIPLSMLGKFYTFAAANFNLLQYEKDSIFISDGSDEPER